MNMNLYKQYYSSPKNFIKSPHDEKPKMIFKGEVYEASFYEYLINELTKNNNDTYKLVGKHAYAPKGKKFILTGFYCDKFGKCIYNSDGVSMAEFDAIKVSESKLVFYECTLIQNPQSLKGCERKFEKKFTLLQLLFPQKEITCVVVSNNNKTLNKFKHKKGYEVHLHQLPEVDLLDIAKRSQYKSISAPEGVVSANSLNKVISDFHYLTNFRKLTAELFNGCSLSSMINKILPYNGLFPRLYWGKVPTSQLIDKIGVVDAEFIIISINVSDTSNPKLRYYFQKSLKGVFEVCKKPTRLHNKKLSVVEILALTKSMPVKNRAELVTLEAEIAQCAPPVC